MVAFVFIWAGTLGFAPTDRSEYEAAAAKAARDAGAHVKLAVWCEAHGMGAERLKHLATALAVDPQNAPAHGMMGLVGYGGKWIRPEKVSETVKADEAMAAKLAQYEAKRQETPETAEAQWQLGLWCEKNGLVAEATAHYSAVTQINPKRTDAWRKLGCEFSHGRWIHAEQAAAERAEEEAQKKADRYWEPILLGWKRDLAYDSPRREEAIAVLNEITDPRAVPSIHRVLARGNHAQQEVAALMLGRIACPASSHALVALSLYESWPEGHNYAMRELKRRDPREYIDEMIGLMHHPYKYHFTPAGPLGEPSTLVIEGDQMRMQRVYEPQEVGARTRRRAGFVPVGPARARTAIGPTRPAAINRFLLESPTAGIRKMALFDQQAAVVMGARASTQEALGQYMALLELQADPTLQARASTQQAMKRDIAIVESFNLKINGANRIVGATLREITGQSLGDDPDVWLTWWNDQLGLRYERIQPRYKETTVQYVKVPFQVHHACFAAGTPVPTLTGPRPIESLQVGDLILSQNTETGVLSFQPIVGIHHNPPAETVRLRVKDETVVSTPVHRFWRAGRGWTMARDLNPGDSIRTVGGRAEVVEIKPDVVRPVFNLDVARNHSFFVGSQQLLVRDNSLPPAMYSPFDAEPDLAFIAKEPTAPSEKRYDESQPSQVGDDVSEPASIWDSPGGSSARREASLPGSRAVQPGSIWDSEGASSGQPRASNPGPRTVRPTGRAPR